MGYAVFSLITSVVTIICIWAIARKNKIRIITGFTFLTDEEIEGIDKNLLKSFVVRILLSVAVLQLTMGIACLFHLTTALLVSQLTWLIVICLTGILMYEFAAKDKNTKKFVKLHSLITIIFLAGSVATVVLLAIR